jgi:HK97 family phage major capsid protein
MSDDRQLLKALDTVSELGTGFLDLAEQHEHRISVLEGRGTKGGGGLRQMIHPGAKGTSAVNGAGIKVHHGEHGEVYELASGAKLADVLPQKHEPDVPLGRWLAAAMLGDRCEDKGALDFFKETKQLTGGTSGVLVPEVFQGEFIDNLRSKMVLEAAGMTTATMTGRTVSASAITSDPPVAWRAEGATLNAGDPTLELRQLVAQSLATRVQASAELAQDSPEFGSQLLDVMGRALAHEIDRVGLVGSGQNNEPRGIYNTVGIGNVPNADLLSYDSFVDGIKVLLEANVELERANRNAIMSPRSWAELEKLRTADGQPIKVPRSLENMAFRPTTSIPNDLGVAGDESTIMLGDFTDLVLGVRLEASVEALRLQTFASNLLLEFVGWTRVDFLVRRPASFVTLSDIDDGA